MNTPAFTHGPAAIDRLSALVRLIRRICLLREQVNAAEAARLEENEFAAALRDYRLAHGAETLPESELRAMFATEERRVAEAVILTELLVPQLAGPLSSVRSGRASPILSVRESPPPVLRPAAAGSPAIPDLLDAMLESERAGHRPLSSARRLS